MTEILNAISSEAIATAEDWTTVEGLRRGDESVFVALVTCYGRAMLRMALLYVPSQQVAEDVVQETWLGVLNGISRFEGRSSLKTWLFRILLNRARTRGVREGRTVPFSALWDADSESAEPAVDAQRFWPADHPEWAHQWKSPPQSWREMPEERLLAQETLRIVQQAIEMLPPNQRQVITLRDLEGWSAQEICNILEVSETNQRVLLHRARSKVRAALEQYLSGG